VVDRGKSGRQVQGDAILANSITLRDPLRFSGMVGVWMQEETPMKVIQVSHVTNISEMQAALGQFVARADAWPDTILFDLNHTALSALRLELIEDTLSDGSVVYNIKVY
jgi:hypothetical protein